jgi:hypothetical protein
MYKAAGYRSAIAVGKEHTAALVYLPGYEKATAVFEIDGEPGWIWAEATGKNNPLGWTSKEYLDVKLAAYEITKEGVVASEPTAPPLTTIAQTGGGGGGGGFSTPLPFFGIIFFLWFIPSLFRRRRRAR